MQPELILIANSSKGPRAVPARHQHQQQPSHAVTLAAATRPRCPARRRLTTARFPRCPLTPLGRHGTARTRSCESHPRSTWANRHCAMTRNPSHDPGTLVLSRPSFRSDHAAPRMTASPTRSRFRHHAANHDHRVLLQLAAGDRQRASDLHDASTACHVRWCSSFRLILRFSLGTRSRSSMEQSADRRSRATQSGQPLARAIWCCGSFMTNMIFLSR
jgi:hypothetical protein